MRFPSQYLDLLIPSDLKQNTDHLFKIRFFMLMMVFIFLNITLPLTLQLTGLKEFHPYFGIEYLMIVFPIAALWVSKNFTFAVNIHFLSLMVSTPIAIFYTGGISSPLAMWVCLIPIFALFYLEFKAALYWMGIVILSFFIIFQVDQFSLLDNIYRLKYQDYDYFINLVFFILFITLGIYLFWSWQQRLIDKIQSQKEVLEDQNLLLEKKTNELNMARQALLNSNSTLELQNDRLSTAKEELVQSNLLLEKQNHTLTTTKSALIESNEALNRYAYTVSHDLQEPLRSISSFSNLLYRHYDKQGLVDSKSKSFFQFVLNGSSNMERLIKEMLQFSEISKDGEGNFKNIDLNQVVQIAQNNLNKQIKETDTEIKVEPLPEIFGLFIPMTQVFQNLITNAIKFRKKDSRCCINIGVEEQSDKWIISVEDNGIGIAKENQQRVFQEFGKIHEKKDYKGQGIGLSTCKKFVQKHGGRIWLESTLNNGTTFSFSIPKKKEVSLKNALPVKQKQKVLIN